MKVIRLSGENFMRVRAVQIDPKGNVVKISGKNGEGKTSTIDMIWAALDLAALGLGQPIRQGAKKAVIKLDMGEVQIERVITAKGHELKVTGADGMKISSPQKFLDALVGRLSFDPLAFERMKPQEQYEELRKAVKIEVDFTAIAQANQRDFDRRTDINRQAKARRAQAEAMPLVGPALPPYDTTELLNELSRAAEHNAKIETRKAKRRDALKEAEDAEREVERLAGEIERLRQTIVGLGAARDAAERVARDTRARLAAAAALPDPIDVTDVRKKLDDATAMNAMSEKARERKRLENEAAELEAQAQALTEAIEARNMGKEQALAAAQMPVAGLSLGEGEVLLNGFPFNQASAAERLRVSMAIAMAANPKVRIIRIADGSLLDSKSMAIVGEMAKDNDFQVWAEIVDETGKVGVVIEDGAVAAVNE